MNDIDAILLIVLLYLVWKTKENFDGGAPSGWSRAIATPSTGSYFLTEFPYEVDSDIVNMSCDQVKLARLF